ncbi:sigma-70 family RNA polymerase sigma factor [Mitsuokella sp.]|uniref:sigma-70 family RNA polymerase sigma factor n=1 Tax=Mitsuokella sp. TaxID=2049034 RepID=UPI0029E50D10|nr:sigma-70 family RNA polymerase sigma factor [Mitsuokella sp.]MDD6382789.1 sigma-70 family RNA polymerase sigma factor [Selenomonadaceae bacterium]MDY4473838.1 sigma-70 family RNA polymerase sigma factor [Mitsuokella sp.]
MRLEQYMKELNKVQLLSPEDEQALWQAFKEEGDTAARQRLIESYQPLVFKQAMPFAHLPCIMDVIQEGTVGLIEAVERYDHVRGVAFSLFAVHRIRGRMLDFLRREGRVDIACMEEKLEDASGTLKENLIDTSASVTEQAESHELSGKLHQAMERLPAKERAVLEGMYLRSEGAAQMADSLQVSSSHIYRLQKSGIRRVRGMLSRFMQYW